MKQIDLKYFWLSKPISIKSNEGVQNLEKIVRFVEKRYTTDASKDNKALRQIAYILATVYHETAMSFKPVKEYGGLKYLRSKSYYPFVGRGFIQLTWKGNYMDMGKRIYGNENYYVNNPDKLLEVDESIKVLDQWFYNIHWKAFSQHTSNENWNLKELRRIVNIYDKWQEIGNIATKIFNALRWEKINVTVNTSPEKAKAIGGKNVDKPGAKKGL